MVGSNGMWLKCLRYPTISLLPLYPFQFHKSIVFYKILAFSNNFDNKLLLKKIDKTLYFFINIKNR